MTNKQRLEDLLIEFDELDMKPMLIVPDPTDRAKAWKHELIYTIKHLGAEVACEIIGIIDKRMELKTEQCKGVHNEIALGVYQGQLDAYRDIKEIIKQKYTEEKT